MTDLDVVRNLALGVPGAYGSSLKSLAVMVLPAFARRFSVFLLAGLLMLVAGPVGAANHYIVLFDVSGSVWGDMKNKKPREFWRGATGNSQAMANRLHRLVRETLVEMPKPFPAYRPDQDVFSFLLFDVDLYNPVYIPEQMFRTNPDLLAATGALPTAGSFERFDDQARTGIRGRTIGLDKVFRGHSPLIIATEVSLPFLSSALSAAGRPVGDQGPIIDNTYLIRITDGKFNTRANGSDEHDAISQIARGQRQRDKYAATDNDDGFAANQALSEKVGRVFDLAAQSKTCGVSTNIGSDPEGLKLAFDCAPDKVAGGDFTFFVKYMQVEPKVPGLAGLARTEHAEVKLDTVYRYSDASIHLTGTNRIFATSPKDADADGLYRLIPNAVEWRGATSDWQRCGWSVPATGEIDCGAAGPLLDFPEGKAPKELNYRVQYQMHFPEGKDGLILYPYRRALEPLSLHSVALPQAEITDMVADLPRDPDRPTLVDGLNPARLVPGGPSDNPKRRIDSQTLKAKAEEWRIEIVKQMSDWVKDWKLPFADGVVPRMITLVSNEKEKKSITQEARLNTIAFASWFVLIIGGVLAAAVVYLFKPRRRLSARLIGKVETPFVLDFNDPPLPYSLLLGMVRIENLRRNPLHTYGFKNLSAVLVRKATQASEGNDPEALRFAVRERGDGAPLAIGAPNKNRLHDKDAAHGREFALFFNPAEVIDLDQDVAAADGDFTIPVEISVRADKVREGALIRLELPLSVRPEQGRLDISCTDAVPLQVDSEEEKAIPVRVVEWRSKERAGLLCTYELRNTARHRFSHPVQGEIGIIAMNHEGKPLDKSIVRLVVGDREGDCFDYHLRRGEESQPDLLVVRVVVDLTKLKNPFLAEDYLVRVRRRDGVQVTPDTHTEGSDDSRDLDESDGWHTHSEWLLRVARSTKRTDCSLVVFESDTRRSEPLNRARSILVSPYLLGTPEHPRPAQYHAVDAQNRMRLCHLHLANACRDGHGHADWTARLVVTSADGISVRPGSLRLIDPRGQPLNHGTLHDALDPSRQEQKLAVELYLKDVTFFQRDAQLQFKVQVDWTVDPDGAMAPDRIARFPTVATISAWLRHAPPPDVLAIDFGTSALAIAHAVGPSAINVLPLPRRLEVIETETGVDRRWDDPVRARNKLFLASEFNVRIDDALLAVTEPNDPAFIDLPMAEIATYNHHDKCFASLKALISAGQLFLPLDVNKHPYQYDGRPENQMQPPLDKVIEGAYKGLVRNFIEPLLGDGKLGYSHVYITHPNTYTAYHVGQLRKIVEEVFSGIAKGRNSVYRENIHFISESDAVACYFLIYAHKYRAPGAVVPQRERILVYDIGAGTLDMTYLEVDWEPKEKGGFTPKNIRVRRRGGVGKAGDLLDECIARDLHTYLSGALDRERYLKPFVVDAASEEMDFDMIRFMDRLRQQIHRLKIEVSEGSQAPALDLVPRGVSDREAIIKTAGDDTPKLYQGCTALRATERGEVFWEPGREGLLNGTYVSAFVARVTDTEVRRFFGGDPPKLDTVILSGRTALWPGLKDRLGATLGNVTNWVDFNADPDTLKKAVVLGAIQREFRWPHVRFESPEALGCFGVRYERAHAEDWHFEPFENSGEEKALDLRDAAEVQIGLLTNNGFHRCYSLLPRHYVVPGESKLTIRLDFNATGYLEAKVTNTHGVTWAFTEIKNLSTLDIKRLPWPLGAAKLHALTPHELLRSDHPEDWK